MKIVDPGHHYRLSILDAEEDKDQPYIDLRFVKRVGEKYPGNDRAYSGTIMQEVLRALIARIYYVNDQIPDTDTARAGYHLREAIHLLEIRAAKRHKRKPPTLGEAIFGEQCVKCLHVGCRGECRP